MFRFKQFNVDQGRRVIKDNLNLLYSNSARNNFQKIV
jgi:hypothetical protein